MARFGFIILLLALLAVWIGPFLGAARSGLQESALGTPSSPATPETLDSSRLELIRGTPGFWRIGRDRDGVWWFVSPDDQLEFLNTVTTVQPYQLGRHPDGPHYRSDDWTGEFRTDSGDLLHWATRTLGRIRGVGFKGLGAWSNPVFHQLDVPMTRDLNVWSWASKACQRLYHPDWEAIAEKAILSQVPQLRENRNLVGYFLDNELHWEGNTPSLYFDHLPPGDPNRQVVVDTIRELWPSIEAFNADWNTSLPGWDDLATLGALPREPASAYSRLHSAFLERVATDYFRLVTGLLRKHDPNHLVLGVRFAGWAPPEVVRASRNYTDAQSINYYVADAMLDQALFEMLYRESGQPVIVSEYSFHALDGRSGNRNTFGFQAQVADQLARAEGYERMTRSLARVPFVIGADWFQWNDEPPSGRTSDGEDVNFGVVDVDDREYETLVDAVRRTTPTLNPLHASADVDARTDLWREAPGPLPTFDVPYVSSGVTLNGSLSEWSQASRIPGLKLGQTLGVERTAIRVPSFHLAWNERGLFIAFEVPDAEIEAAPATGRWWTRDCVEFWIATRPVPPDQVIYNAYCHQFFFVPVSMPDRDGQSGTFGQWHREGDALTQHRIPHPQIKFAARVLADRYVVEAFIPAEALHGFDTASSPTLAFNLHVRDFQAATDAYWSAGKEQNTQLRPNTWGVLRLMPPAPDSVAQTR